MPNFGECIMVERNIVMRLMIKKMKSKIRYLINLIRRTLNFKMLNILGNTKTFRFFIQLQDSMFLVKLFIRLCS